jgi:hypothetical protein
MAGMSMTSNQGNTNATAAAIMARAICPEKAGWTAQVAREFLRFHFADEDLTRFHALLAMNYANAMTANEHDELDRYMFVNCFLELIREGARRSIDEAATV